MRTVDLKIWTQPWKGVSKISRTSKSCLDCRTHWDLCIEPLSSPNRLFPHGHRLSLKKKKISSSLLVYLILHCILLVLCYTMLINGVHCYELIMISPGSSMSPIRLYSLKETYVFSKSLTPHYRWPQQSFLNINKPCQIQTCKHRYLKNICLRLRIKLFTPANQIPQML